MSRTYLIEVTAASRVADPAGLPSPRYEPLLQGTDYAKHTGRFLDAVSEGAHVMLRHGRDYACSAGMAQFLSGNAAFLLQTLTIRRDDDKPMLMLQQILHGWPLVGNLWFERIGRPALSPLRRIPKCPRTDDVNGQYTPLPVRLYTAHKKHESNNKVRLWRVSAEGLPPSYCVFWPDGDCRFIHVARLVQHYLAADPEHWQDYL